MVYLKDHAGQWWRVDNERIDPGNPFVDQVAAANNPAATDYTIDGVVFF